MDDYIGQKKKIVTIKEKQINENGEEIEVDVAHDLKDIEESLDCNICYFEISIEMLKDYDNNMRKIQPEDFVTKNKKQMR